MRAIPPALPTRPVPAGSGTGSRGRGERSEGGRGRRRERSVATQERSFATGGGSVPTQRRAQRPGRVPGMAPIAGRRPSSPLGGGAGGRIESSKLGRARALPRPGWGAVCPSQGWDKARPVTGPHKTRQGQPGAGSAVLDGAAGRADRCRPAGAQATDGDAPAGGATARAADPASASGAAIRDGLSGCDLLGNLQAPARPLAGRGERASLASQEPSRAAKPSPRGAGGRSSPVTLIPQCSHPALPHRPQLPRCG